MGAAEGSTSAKTLSVCLQDRKHCRWQTRIRRRLHRGDNPKYPFVCLFVFPGKSAAVTTPQPPCQFRVLCPAGDAERCGAMRSSPDTLDSSGEARPAGGGRGSTGNAAPRGGTVLPQLFWGPVRASPPLITPPPSPLLGVVTAGGGEWHAQG